VKAVILSSFCAVVGALVGGFYSDKSAAAFPEVPEGRLKYSISAMWAVPVGE
jgi:hypothetical protein